MVNQIQISIRWVELAAFWPRDNTGIYGKHDMVLPLEAD